MRMSLATATCLSFLLAGCGSDGGGAVVDADPFAPDADLFAPDADPFAPDAVPGAPDAEPVVPIAVCLPTCATVTDCTAQSPILDADNYTCDQGACRWHGCNNTTECQNAFNDPDYICAQPAGYTIKNCLPSCQTAADCGQGADLYNSDNYQCQSGACVWQGCNSTAECTAALGAQYQCARFPGASFDNCLIPCSNPATCTSTGSLFSADNYTCDSGFCEWTGCNATSECQETFMNPNYICQ